MFKNRRTNETIEISSKNKFRISSIANSYNTISIKTTERHHEMMKSDDSKTERAGRRADTECCTIPGEAWIDRESYGEIAGAEVAEQKDVERDEMMIEA